MAIDNNYEEADFRVNLDIVLNNFPCHMLSLCQEDDLGHHTVGVEKDLQKIRLNS